MKHGTDAIECDAHSRSAAFRYFGSVVQKHRFNVRPGDVDAFFEDGCQHALVFTHQLMISKNDIGMGGGDKITMRKGPDRQVSTYSKTHKIACQYLS